MNHAIIVLAYNEEGNIGPLIERLHGYHVIAVVDGNDRTASIAKALGGDVLESDEKRGYGKALIEGLSYAAERGFTYATVMDVGTCDPGYISIYSGADILVRNRVVIHKVENPKRVILSRIAAIATSLATLSCVPDATYGYRTYNLLSVYPLLEDIVTNGHSTNMELLGLAINAGLNIQYKPVPYTLDENSQLKSTDLKEALRCVLRMSFIHRLLTS